MSQEKLKPANTKRIEVATLGGGCFWCTEAVFSQLKGCGECRISAGD